MVICKYCSKEFSNISNLNVHIKKYHLEEIKNIWLKCPYCIDYFATTRALNLHISKKHKDKIINEVKTPTKYTPKQKYKCQICGGEYLKLGHHINNSHPDITKQKYYDQYLKKDPNEGVCQNELCHNVTQFYGITRGYSKFCSHKCAGQSEQTKEKIKQTCIEHFGVDNPFKSDRVNEKKKKTIQEKYGVGHISQYSKIKEKKKKKSLEQYGTEYPTQSTEVKEKTKQTMKEKYGGYTWQSEELNQKFKSTMSKKYGTEIPLRNNEIKEKYKETNKQKYYNNLNDTNRIDNTIIPMFKQDEYIGVNQTYPFKCLTCNTLFVSDLNNGKNPKCPICFPCIHSKGEQELYEYIVMLIPNEIIIQNDSKILNGKELDIYIPSRKLAIEFNGLYWHSEVGRQTNKKYHLEKTIECEKQDIQLIHIFEDEWKYKQDIVKMRLKHILKLHDKVIYARKCNIKEIETKEKQKFLKETHIQGPGRSKIKLGAFYGKELIAVMTFGVRRLALGVKKEEHNKDEYELLRFATKYHSPGIASKLFKHFIRNYNPIKIISYADRRWSQGNLYEKLGFKKVSDGVVNYWYMKNHDIRIHRFNFRKQVLNKKLEVFDPNLTEWQNMVNNGYDRIWDCGSLKYEWNLT